MGAPSDLMGLKLRLIGIGELTGEEVSKSKLAKAGSCMANVCGMNSGNFGLGPFCVNFKVCLRIASGELSVIIFFTSSAVSSGILCKQKVGVPE